MGEQVLHVATSPYLYHYLYKPGLPQTICLIQGTRKDSLLQNVAAGNMAESDQLQQTCKQCFLVSYECGDRTSYKGIGFTFLVPDPEQSAQALVLEYLDFSFFVILTRQVFKLCFFLSLIIPILLYKDGQNVKETVHFIHKHLYFI